jgi:hypothetical protein
MLSPPYSGACISRKSGKYPGTLAGRIWRYLRRPAGPHQKGQDLRKSRKSRKGACCTRRHEDLARRSRNRRGFLLASNWDSRRGAETQRTGRKFSRRDARKTRDPEPRAKPLRLSVSGSPVSSPSASTCPFGSAGETSTQSGGIFLNCTAKEASRWRLVCWLFPPSCSSWLRVRSFQS